MKQIAIFGDSITAGWTGHQPTEILKELVETALRSQYQINGQVRLFGLPGDDTKGAVKRLKAVKLADADYYFIFFGANDAAEHHLVSTADYRRNLEKIISQLTGTSVLITPPAVDETRIDSTKRSNQRVEAYCQVVYQLGQQFKLPVIDLYHQMMIYPGNSEFFQADGLHFSRDGYDLLAFLIAKTVNGIENKR